METNKPDKLEIPAWWSPGGGMMYRRDSLHSDHPESTYMYCKNMLNIVPEEYGVYHSDYLEYKDMNREELINELVKVKRNLRQIEPYL